MDSMRKIFRLMNKYFMIPLFRLGLGTFMGTPFGGYMMVLQLVGHKTGKTRFAPVNYAIMDGQVYCMAGFGRRTHWLKNLLANPDITVILPGRRITGHAVEVTDAGEKMTVLRQVLRNAGFAGFLEGYNPRRAADEQLQGTLERAVVIRIQPTGVLAGPADPGGWLWWALTLGTVIIIALLLF